MTDPGIEDGVEDVDGEVDQDEGDGDQHDRALDHEVVPLEDGLDDEAADER